jgi:hypothetical protein
MYNTLNKIIIIISCVLVFTIKTNAQEVRVIDNKGSIIPVNNNLVNTAATAPLNPVEGDIWFDTANNIIKIYDVIDGWKDITATSLKNIYTADGTLTNSRTLTGASNSLIFNGLNTFTTTTLGATTINSGGATVLNATGGVTINNNTLVNGSLELNSTLLDINNEAGTNNQILSSTATGIDWIDNTKNTVNISSTETTPADYITANPTYTPIENDTYIYIPANAEKVYYVYDGATWNMIAPTKASRVFYPPSIAIDASTAGNYTLDLYNDVYRAQFDVPLIRSDLGGTDEAPVSIPTYQNSNELYYYVTEADLNVFGDGTTLTNMSINAAGVLSYTIVTPPTDDNTIINVVFVVK